MIGTTWRGPVLSDVPPTGLIIAEVHRLTEQRLDAWEAHIEIGPERGRQDSVIGERPTRLRIVEFDRDITGGQHGAPWTWWN